MSISDPGIPDLYALEDVLIAGRYRLEGFLGEGGFGVVYRASHLAFGKELRKVAVKIAKRPMTESEACELFNDALEVARLADVAPDAAVRDRFVAVYDAGRCAEGSPLAGHPYAVMELVGGGSLKGRLRAGPLPLACAATYFDQILEAMDLMHRGVPAEDGRLRPVLHRDLKTSNILVVRRPEGPDLLKVADFGLAVEIDSLLGWVESGGDLAYMAPESFSHLRCTLRTDVYMLGLVFYEMITRVSPFSEVGSHLRGSDEEKRDELRRLHLEARQRERFHQLEEHPELRLQPALAAVIRTSLAADPESRKFRNAGELCAAWREARRKGCDGPSSLKEEAWDTVRRLKVEADQCYRVGNEQRGDSLLEAAMRTNKNTKCVPDSMMVGSAYLLWVQRLIGANKNDMAGREANEGHQRRPCRSTFLAMAAYYDATGEPQLAANFKSQADTCKDRE